MTRLYRLLIFTIFAGSAIAQIPAPQINLSGNIGCQGFPCVNTGTLIMASDTNRALTAQETSAFSIEVTSSVSLTATRNLIWPAGRFPVDVENATTGGQSIQVIGASGTGVTIPNGSTYRVWNDGTNFVQISSASGSGSAIACTGTGDDVAINAALAGGNKYVQLTGACVDTPGSSLLLYSGDTLNWSAASITVNQGSSPNPLMTDHANVTPTTRALTCTLAASSNSATCSSGAFTIANDLEQSFYCPNASGNSTGLYTSIAQISSSTVVLLADATASSISPGSFSCVETTRDHDITLIPGTTTLTSSNVYPNAPFVAYFTHINRLTISGGAGYWYDPDGTSNWHIFIGDSSHTLVDGQRFFSYNSPGTDGVHWIGPARDLTATNISCITSDDCVTLDSGEGSAGTPLAQFKTFGSIKGARIDGVQGSSSGTVGVFLLSDCINTSPCTSATIQNVSIKNVVGHSTTNAPIGDGALAPGFAQGVGIYGQGGTPGLIDNVRIEGVSGYIGTCEVCFGWGTGITSSQNIGRVYVSGLGNSTIASEAIAAIVGSPATVSIASLSVDAEDYTGTAPLLVSNAQATITKYITNNKNTSLYTQGGASINGSTTNATSLGVAGPIVAESTIAQSVAGSFAANGMTDSAITGSTQCVHANSSGQLSGTGSDCGSGGGNMSDGSGTSTVGDFPETTSTTHSYSLNTPSQVLSQIGAAPAIPNATLETSSFSAACNAGFIGNDASALTATLPGSPAAGCLIGFQNIGAGTMTISAGSAIIYNGSTTLVSSTTLATGQQVSFWWTGINWTTVPWPTSGSGNTTSTSLTSNTLPKANGANSIINSLFTDNGTTGGYAGTGGINASGGPVAGTNGYFGSPSSAAKAALPTGANGMSEDESTTAGVPASAVDYLRADATAHCLKGSYNGSTESCVVLATSLVNPTATISTATSSSLGSGGSYSAPACLTGWTCDGLSGMVTFTTGTSPTTNGGLFSVTVGTARAAKVACVFADAIAFDSLAPLSGSLYENTPSASTTLAEAYSYNLTMTANTQYEVSYVCGK
jgi:hypothetical protein